jgi:hypothetical protein
MDKQFNMIIPPRYDEVQPFQNGFANVVLNGEKTKIDKKGNIIE